MKRLFYKIFIICCFIFIISIIYNVKLSAHSYILDVNYDPCIPDDLNGEKWYELWEGNNCLHIDSNNMSYYVYDEYSEYDEESGITETYKSEFYIIKWKYNRCIKY